MNQVVLVFIGGIGGVFIGMGLLYASIRITSIITGKFETGGEKK